MSKAHTRGRSDAAPLPQAGRIARASTAFSRRTSRTRWRCCACCRTSGWAGKVKFIGFDASDTLVKGLSDGHIDGLVVQDPVKMGYLGVKTMVEHLKGRAGREAHRHRRPAHHPRQNERSRRQGAAAARSFSMVEAVTRLRAAAARQARNSRCAACAKRSAAPSRSTASISRCAGVKCARWSARTAPARAR